MMTCSEAVAVSSTVKVLTIIFYIALVSTGCFSMSRFLSIRQTLLIAYFCAFFFLASKRNDRSKLVAYSVSGSDPDYH